MSMARIVISSFCLLILMALNSQCIGHSMGRLHYVEFSAEGDHTGSTEERHEVQCENFLDPDGMYSEVSEYMLESGIESISDFKITLVPSPEKGALATCIVLEGGRQ